MTTFVFLLVFLLFAAIGLGLTLRRLRRTGEDFPPIPSALGGQPADEVYRPMARLFAKQDLEFLHEQSGYHQEMDRRLRSQRRKILRLYLGQVRSDFRTMQKYCRLLVRKSHNWELNSLAQQQLVVFYGLFFALQVRCLLGSFAYVQVDTGDLVSALRNLQNGMRTVMESLDRDVRIAAAVRS